MGDRALETCEEDCLSFRETRSAWHFKLFCLLLVCFWIQSSVAESYLMKKWHTQLSGDFSRVTNIPRAVLLLQHHLSHYSGKWHCFYNMPESWRETILDSLTSKNHSPDPTSVSCQEFSIFNICNLLVLSLQVINISKVVIWEMEEASNTHDEIQTKYTATVTCRM